MAQLVAKKDKIEPIIALMQDRWDEAIPVTLRKYMTPERGKRILLNIIQNTPKVLDCTKESIVQSLLQAAQLGLEADGLLGQAYLIPFKTTCTFMIGYKGLIELTRRSDQISMIYAVVVYSGDSFNCQMGTDPKIEHTPAESKAGAMSHVYAVAKFKDGSIQFDVMTKEQVDKIRARSKYGDSGPWKTDYDEMAKKTVLRRLCKLLPASTEDNRIQKAIVLDELGEIGKPQPIDLTMNENPPEVIDAESTVKEGVAGPPVNPDESVDDLF